MKRFMFWLDYYWIFIVNGLKMIVTFIFVIMFHLLPFKLRSIKLRSYNRETCGEIITVERIIGLNQTEVGAEVAANAYEIRYKYQVGEQEFRNFEFLNIRGLILEEVAELNLLEIGDTIQLKYKFDHPGKSIMVFNYWD